MPQTSVSSAAELFRQVLFEVDNPAGQLVVYLIFVLFAVGLIDLVLASAQTIANHAALSTARKRLHDRDADNALPLDTEALLPLLGLTGAAGRSDLARWVRHFVRVALNPQLDGRYARDVTEARLDQRGSIARFLAGTLTVVGLVGTVLGLSIAVHELPSLISRIDSADTLQVFSGRMLQTLAGMGTAFSCTLAGLSAALVLSILCYLLRTYQIHVSVGLESFAHEILLPQLLGPKPEEAARGLGRSMEAASHQLGATVRRLEAASTSVQTGAASFEKAVRALESQVSGLQSAASTLQDAAASIRTLSDLPERIQKASVEGVSAAIQTTVPAMRQQVARDIGELAESFALANKEQQDAYADLFTGMREEVREITGVVDAPLKGLSASQVELSAVLRKLAEALENGDGRRRDGAIRAAGAIPGDGGRPADGPGATGDTRHGAGGYRPIDERAPAPASGGRVTLMTPDPPARKGFLGIFHKRGNKRRSRS